MQPIRTTWWQGVLLALALGVVVLTASSLSALAPKQRDEIVKALGPKVTVQESLWDCILLVTMNHEKSPLTTNGCVAPRLLHIN